MLHYVTTAKGLWYSFPSAFGLVVFDCGLEKVGGHTLPKLSSNIESLSCLDTPQRGFSPSARPWRPSLPQITQ